MRTPEAYIMPLVSEQVDEMVELEEVISATVDRGSNSVDKRDGRSNVSKGSLERLSKDSAALHAPGLTILPLTSSTIPVIGGKDIPDLDASSIKYVPSRSSARPSRPHGTASDETADSISNYGSAPLSGVGSSQLSRGAVLKTKEGASSSSTPSASSASAAAPPPPVTLPTSLAQAALPLKYRSPLAAPPPLEINLGTYTVDDVQLWVMGSHGPRNEYVSCGGVRLE